MTPERFLAAMVMFHAVVLLAAWRVAGPWRDPLRCGRRGPSWVSALVADAVLLAVVTYVASVAATVSANLGYGARLHLGAISTRLMGQALFGEAIVFALGLAVGAAALFAVYVDAYHVEPRLLYVRHHEVAPSTGPTTRSFRILHMTDIQTPVIGAHEERALREGVAERPDLIVLTGDYIEEAMGRHTEGQAVPDLRALMARVGFTAPLGVFATDGDAGPPCGEVFAGTPVRCLVDASAPITLPGGATLSITGLSRNRGRERDPAWLSWILSRAPRADHRIVISHAPDFVDALPEPVDLVLAGHTHGGQVVIPFFGPPRTAMRLPRLYAGDLHDHRGTPLHVSRGVGMERDFMPPVRFLCPPEICVLDLRL
jgi:predicted MPP superfamily phosphohydrolase